MKRTDRKIINWTHELGVAAHTAWTGVTKFMKILIDVLLTVIIIGGITGILVACVFTIYIKNYVVTEVDVDQFRVSVTAGTKTTSIYCYDFTDRANRVGTAELMSNERIIGGSDSTYITFDKIPENMMNAVIAIEDKRFKTHAGVDWKRTIAAGANFFLSFDEAGYGGSTITQQLIKNMTGEDDYKIQRKIQEIFWALDLETKMDKEEIIELYLNIVNFGNGSFGIEEAAYGYFSKRAEDLTLIECAAIASITKNPAYFNPIVYPEHNAKRRNTVLYEMLDQGLITQREYDEAAGKELVLRLPDEEEEEEIEDIKEEVGGTSWDLNSGINSWYVDMVINDVIADLVKEYGYTNKVASLMVYNGGLDIYTLMDRNIQEEMEKIFTDESNYSATKTGQRAQSSGIVIDTETGDILGVVGSRERKNANRILNYATDTKRPPGSSIKPLAVYSQSIEAGLINWATIFDDVPFEFRTSSTGWPKDSHNYRGLSTVHYALAHSLNAVAVKVLDLLGTRRSFDFCTNTLQMKSLVERKEAADGSILSDVSYAALGLGQLTDGITVREMAAAYSIFPNNGVYNECHSYLKVLDNQGTEILSNPYRGTVAISEDTASIMNLILEDVIREGTATKVKFGTKTGIDTAGKTGTAGDTDDWWFIGYTPYYICGLWYGYDIPAKLSGTNPNFGLFDKIMTAAHKDVIERVTAGEETYRKFKISDNIVTCTYCADSGKLCSDACALDPRGNRSETGYFIRGTEPTEYCDTHIIVDYCTSGRGIACDYCPREDVVQTALIRMNRDFPTDILVTDSQYTYLELPYNVRPYYTKYRSYYYYMSVYAGEDGAKHYYGRVSGSILPYNRACTTHFNATAWKKKVAEIKAEMEAQQGVLPVNNAARRFDATSIFNFSW